MSNREISCSTALREALEEEMERDDTIFIIGEDLVAHGGIFGQFEGLPERFPGRVIDSPISETCIVGSGVGAALTGMRPVVDMHFADFVTTGMDEIANQGGTTAYYEAADPSAFVNTLQTIVGDVVSCEFDIDWDSLPDEASQDPNMVNFYGDGGLIPYDENCEDGSGWHWIDSDTVEFCEDACADLKSGTWGTVTATFGCESIPIE